MSNRSRNGEGVVNSDRIVKTISTGCAAPCGHEGTVVALTKGGTGRAEGFKCLACGSTFAEDPNEAAIKEYEEAIEKADKDVRALLDQAAENINRIAGKRDCLKEADKIINGERQDSYGAPEDSFTIIAGYWNVFLTAKLKALGIDVKDLLSPLDTTNMMVLFKQARKLGQKPSRDNYVDSCGYEAIGADRLSE